MSIIFSSPINSALLSYKLKNGKIIRLGDGIYSDDLTTPARTQISYHIDTILTHLGVEGAYAWRSAFGIKSKDDRILLEGRKARSISLAEGMSVTVIATPSFDEKHRLPVHDGSALLRPSFYRAVLENLSQSKVFAKRSNAELSKSLLKDRLLSVAINNPHGVADELLVFRSLAGELGLESSLQEIERVAIAISDDGVFRSARARPVDTMRIQMFEQAAEKLSLSLGALTFDSSDATEKQQDNLDFLESYFSNYIEGTEFEIEEAEQIVYESGYNESHARSADGHDILALYRIIKQPSQRLVSAGEYIDATQRWNRELMSHRMANAGEFKTSFNRAGGTRFVAPELAHETLLKAFSMAKEIPAGFARAAFLKLAFVEVHPFVDGNGRVSRLLMNNEMQQAGLNRFIVPTVFREDYLLALKAFSQAKNIFPFERMMSRLAAINRAIPKEEDRNVLIRILREKSAFCHAADSIWGVAPPSGDESPIDPYLIK